MMQENLKHLGFKGVNSRGNVTGGRIEQDRFATKSKMDRAKKNRKAKMAKASRKQNRKGA